MLDVQNLAKRMGSEMNKRQADYCDKLQSGDIEVAVPCENALSLFELEFYAAQLWALGLSALSKEIII